jgi:hypothetical protein
MRTHAMAAAFVMAAMTTPARAADPVALYAAGSLPRR